MIFVVYFSCFIHQIQILMEKWNYKSKKSETQNNRHIHFVNFKLELWRFYYKTINCNIIHKKFHFKCIYETKIFSYCELRIKLSILYVNVKYLLKDTHLFSYSIRYNGKVFLKCDQHSCCFLLSNHYIVNTMIRKDEKEQQTQNT